MGFTVEARPARKADNLTAVHSLDLTFFFSLNVPLSMELLIRSLRNEHFQIVMFWL
jgi:hypothetical protein